MTWYDGKSKLEYRRYRRNEREDCMNLGWSTMVLCGGDDLGGSYQDRWADCHKNDTAWLGRYYNHRGRDFLGDCSGNRLYRGGFDVSLCWANRFYRCGIDPFCFPCGACKNYWVIRNRQGFQSFHHRSCLSEYSRYFWLFRLAICLGFAISALHTNYVVVGKVIVVPFADTTSCELCRKAL